MDFCVLSSGSRANASVFRTDQGCVVVDCGLTWKMLSMRMKDRGFDPLSITAVVISHEHRDHVMGVLQIAKRTGATIYLTEKTARAWREFWTDKPKNWKTFLSGESFEILDLSFTSFAISHDAVDPVGFRIKSSDSTVAMVTDLGHVTSTVREHVRNVDALILESNHDLDLLENCPYPRELKSRIASRHGHLSNDSAAALLEECIREDGCRLHTVIAAHISENANDPSIVKDSLLPSIAARESCSLVTASARVATDVFSLKGSVVTKKDCFYPVPLPLF